MAGRQNIRKILLIDDNIISANSYGNLLKRENIICDHVRVMEVAQKMISSESYSAVIINIQKDDRHNLLLLRKMKLKNRFVNIIILSNNGSINSAVEFIKAGAFDFRIKPLSPINLVECIKKAVIAFEDNKSAFDNAVPEAAPGAVKGQEFIGNSAKMMPVYNLISRVAHSKAPVFITGESGTGKDVCAEMIHKISGRENRPFVALNCAAIPAHLVESELFGHVKGAFTGALEDRMGAIRKAHGGTLFLDEICEFEISLQAKLLRFLQTGKCKKVGSDNYENFNIRILCASNRDPREEVKQKNFRQDLFYRLDTLTIDLPPLRERGGDIVDLAFHFLRQYAREEKCDFTDISPEAQRLFNIYEWPGNIREMQNVIRKILVMFDGHSISSDMVLETISFGGPVVECPQSESLNLDTSCSVNLKQSMDEMERDIISAVINSYQGNIAQASESLKLSPSTIYRKRESWVASDESSAA